MAKSELFRLNAASRSVSHTPKDVLAYSRVGSSPSGSSQNAFCVPPLQELENFRVVVSTCFSASIPYGIGFQRGHFSYIFVDEAGQGTEPEVMIPIKLMADRKTNIVLSGDNKQLGPIVRSPIARELGLATSYLDRMMSSPLYDETKGHGKT